MNRVVAVAAEVTARREFRINALKSLKPRSAYGVILTRSGLWDSKKKEGLASALWELRSGPKSGL